jgi:excisionase family DNA binding protein
VSGSSELSASGLLGALADDHFIKRLADALVSRVLSERAPTTKRLFTLAEAAEYIGRSPKAVEHLIHRGAIPVTKLDGKRQVDRETLDKIIAEHTYFEV